MAQVQLEKADKNHATTQHSCSNYQPTINAPFAACIHIGMGYDMTCAIKEVDLLHAGSATVPVIVCSI